MYCIMLCLVAVSCCIVFCLVILRCVVLSRVVLCLNTQCLLYFVFKIYFDTGFAVLHFFEYDKL